MVQTCNPTSEPDRQSCCQQAEGLLSPEFFRALGDGTRTGVLLRLAELGRPSTVSEVAGCCPRDLSVVSRHLKVLRQVGIVAAQRQGKEVRYQVLYGALATTLREMADAIEACCPSEMAGTETETEGEGKADADGEGDLS